MDLITYFGSEQMRLWSLHPKYLDSQGLVALWREALLAQKVLNGFTKGYRHHPQLERFKNLSDPLVGIAAYLFIVYEEAHQRGYHFEASKIQATDKMDTKILVTKGQILYEFEHLKNKLRTRNPAQFKMLKTIHLPRIHPLFELIPGNIEPWEKI